MKTRTEKILVVMTYAALIVAIAYSIECGKDMLALGANLRNPEWARRMYEPNFQLLDLIDYNRQVFINVMSIIIALSGLKATIWYRIMDLLTKLKMETPFSIEVANKLATITYLLFGVGIVGIIGNGYVEWLSKHTNMPLTSINIGDEYLLIAGMVYIIYQIFKRGIELQEENQLTV